MKCTISNREKEILTLISNEYNNQDIAKHLFISIHTVITHRRNLLAKLEATNSAGMIRRGFETGILRVNN